MSERKSILPGLLVAAAALAVSGGAGALVLWALGRGEPNTVELVDSEAGLEAAFQERDAAGLARAGTGDLTRLPIGQKVAEQLFPAIGRSQVYDPRLLARHKPNKNLRQRLAEHPRGGWRLVTNAAGFREDAALASDPELRVIVVGDSHVDGVCDNRDAFPNLLEARLAERHAGRAIEVVNGGTGGWSFYNYLGALEAWLELEPDLFVVTVYGGNDFYGALDLHHYHRGEKRAKRSKATVAKLVKLSKTNMGIASQYYQQAAYFHDHPAEEAAARAMAREVTLEIARRCAAAGVELLCVYLPPYAHGQPEAYGEYLTLAQEHVPLPAEALAADERLADGWLADLAAAGVRAVDLRPPFRASQEALYWESDHHISLAGQRRVADELLGPVEELLGLGR